MEQQTITAKALLTTIIAAGSAIWGWGGWLVILWIACMALDYITGTLAAIKEHSWSSRVAREGLWHKGGMILIVLVAAMTDAAASLVMRADIAPELPFDHSELLSVIVLSWYSLTELGSSLENATKLTDRVPKWLTRFLAIAASKVAKAGKHIADRAGDDDKADRSED